MPQYYNKNSYEIILENKTSIDGFPMEIFKIKNKNNEKKLITKLKE